MIVELAWLWLLSLVFQRIKKWLGVADDWAYLLVAILSTVIAAGYVYFKLGFSLEGLTLLQMVQTVFLFAAAIFTEANLFYRFIIAKLDGAVVQPEHDFFVTVADILAWLAKLIGIDIYVIPG